MKLHELIELAKQGNKFRAFAKRTESKYTGPWCDNEWFNNQTVYPPWLVTADWTMEEIRDPVKLEWTFDNITRTGKIDIPCSLIGKPFKVTFEEILIPKSLPQQNP